jgi:hypothetical protein
VANIITSREYNNIDLICPPVMFLWILRIYCENRAGEPVFKQVFTVGDKLSRVKPGLLMIRSVFWKKIAG